MSLSLVAAGVVSVALAWGAGAQTSGTNGQVVDLTVMGTSDMHGNVYNWDYFNDRPYSDSRGNSVGFAKISTLVEQVRAERGEESTLLIDNGDTIQGTPLTYYYAQKEPATEPGVEHPISKVMNHIGYDAFNLGNHEFNYGLPLLDEFVSELDAPTISANTERAGTDDPAYKPYVIKTVKIEDQKPIKVGIIGFTPPGNAIWDRRNVEGRLEFPDIVETAERYVPELDRQTDVVIAASHSGTSGTSSYDPSEAALENASTKLAEEVPGIDAILAGHSHTDIPERFVTNEETGEEVLLTQPYQWGGRLAVMDLGLQKFRGQWDVVSKNSETLNTNAVEADPEVLDLVAEEHQTTVDYVNTPIGTSTTEMTSAESRYKDTPIIDLINRSQTDAVDSALEGTADRDLPVLSIAAPFSRTSRIPAGEVTVKDIAGLYIYDNTLLAVEMNGSQLEDYLEYSAKYFNQQPESGAVDPATLTGANRTPDYNYDIVSGVSYDIDVSKPVGQRIENLTYNGQPVGADQEFAVAINNYRQSGGGSFPHVRGARVLYNEQQEIRQLLIEWVQERGVIAPEQFFEQSWRLTRNGQPVFEQ